MAHSIEAGVASIFCPAEDSDFAALVTATLNYIFPDGRYNQAAYLNFRNLAKEIAAKQKQLSKPLVPRGEKDIRNGKSGPTTTKSKNNGDWTVVPAIIEPSIVDGGDYSLHRTLVDIIGGIKPETAQDSRGYRELTTLLLNTLSKSNTLAVLSKWQDHILSPVAIDVIVDNDMPQLTKSMFVKWNRINSLEKMTDWQHTNFYISHLGLMEDHDLLQEAVKDPENENARWLQSIIRQNSIRGKIMASHAKDLFLIQMGHTGTINDIKVRKDISRKFENRLSSARRLDALRGLGHGIILLLPPNSFNRLGIAGISRIGKVVKPLAANNPRLMSILEQLNQKIFEPLIQETGVSKEDLSNLSRAVAAGRPELLLTVMQETSEEKDDEGGEDEDEKMEDAGTGDGYEEADLKIDGRLDC